MAINQTVTALAASALSLWTAICLRYYFTKGDATPSTDGYASERVGRLLLALPIRYSNSSRSSIELLVILIHVYVLATATLWHARRGDRFQHLVVKAWWLTSAASCVERHWMAHPGQTDTEVRDWWLHLQMGIFTLGLPASAAAHAGVNWWRGESMVRDHVEVVGDQLHKRVEKGQQQV